MKNLILILLISFSFTMVFGQDASYPEVKKYFLITASTKDYDVAKKSAEKIAKDLSLELKLRGLKEYGNNEGLTYEESECEENGWEAPCYVSRGRYDDGEYVSIEWSNAISGFTKGYYVVIISSQDSNDSKMKTLLIKARKSVPSAYVKSSMVYIGCMH